MSAPREAVEAAYAVLDRYGMVHHYSCVVGPDRCQQRQHERARVAEVVESALALTPIPGPETVVTTPPSWAECLQGAEHVVVDEATRARIFKRIQSEVDL